MRRSGEKMTVVLSMEIKAVRAKNKKIVDRNNSMVEYSTRNNSNAEIVLRKETFLYKE